MCEFYSRISRTKFTALRHSNVFDRHDTFDLDKSHLCAATIKKVCDFTGKILLQCGETELKKVLFVDILLMKLEGQNKEKVLKYLILIKGISVKELVQMIINISGKK